MNPKTEVHFEDIEEAYAANFQIHVPIKYLNDKEKLRKVLNEEINHLRDEGLQRIQNRYLEWFFKWFIERKFILILGIFFGSLFLQHFTNEYTLQQALNMCNSELNKHIIIPIISNLTR